MKVRLTGTEWTRSLHGFKAGDIVDAVKASDGDFAEYTFKGKNDHTFYIYGKSHWSGETVEEAAERILKESAVKAPSHYVGRDGTELYTVMMNFGLLEDAERAQAVQYIFRAPHKGEFAQDIEKAIEFLQRRLARFKAEEAE